MLRYLSASSRSSSGLDFIGKTVDDLIHVRCKSRKNWEVN